MNDWPWDVLGVEPGADERTLRRIYARQIKQGVDEDPEAFQRLRAAYEMALHLVQIEASQNDKILVKIYEADDDKHEQEPVPDGPGMVAAGVFSSDLHSPFLTDSRQDAEQLWKTIVADAESLESERSIRQFFNAVESLSTRDELEWLALQYCGDAATPSAQRRAIAEALGWNLNENTAYLYKRDVAIAAQAFGLINADEDYQNLKRQFPGPMRAVEQPVPNEWLALWRMIRGRYPDMGRFLYALGGYAANVARFRLAKESVDFWQRVALRHAKLKKCFTAIPLLGVFGILLGESIANLLVSGQSDVWYANVWLDASFALVAMIALAIGELRYPSRWERWRFVVRENPIVCRGWAWLWLLAALFAFAMPMSREVSGLAGVGLALALVWAIVIYGWPPDCFGLFVRACGFVALAGLLRHQFFSNGGWYTALVFGALFGLARLHRMNIWIERLRYGSYRLLWIGLWLFVAIVVVTFLISDPSGSMREVPNYAQFLPNSVRPMIEPLGAERVLNYCWALYAWLCVAGYVLGDIDWSWLINAMRSVFPVYQVAAALILPLVFWVSGFAAIFVLLCLAGSILRTYYIAVTEATR